MQFFLRHRTLIIVAFVLVAGLSLYLLTKEDAAPDWVTGTVEKGAVRELVSVSGIIESEGEATLSFPVSGIVSDVLVAEGATVTEGQILATLEQDELVAERQDAYAALLIAQADKDELESGPRTEARDITKATVEIARADLERTVSEEAKKVANAYRTLLSDDLEALPLDANVEDVPPTISGTYTCAKEGVYTMEVFRSGSQSGYAYRIDGLETGTSIAFTESPQALGTCGLSIQFAPDEQYGNKTWEIRVPNTRASSYTTNLNAYLLAKEQEANQVAARTQALDKALREQTLENALPRSEALVRARAAVIQAESRLAQIDARIKDRTLRAPFDATVSNIELTRGEVPQANAMTVVAADIFELTVRIPEIDITRVHIGQRADMVFDARPSELVTGAVSFIASVATEIDGVAYFEAKLRFDATPAWMRSGLNADVDIIVNEVTDVTKVGKRFLETLDTGTYVLYPAGTVTRKEKVDVTFTGNDGFVAITGNVHAGDTIVAP